MDGVIGSPRSFPADRTVLHQQLPVVPLTASPSGPAAAPPRARFEGVHFEPRELLIRDIVASAERGVHVEFLFGRFNVPSPNMGSNICVFESKCTEANEEDVIR